MNSDMITIADLETCAEAWSCADDKAPFDIDKGFAKRLVAFVRAGDVFRAATEKFLNGATHPGAMAAAGLAYDEARATLNREES